MEIMLALWPFALLAAVIGLFLFGPKIRRSGRRDGAKDIDRGWAGEARANLDDGGGGAGSD